jgi:eukaryotic-like serine/threonine-protein kinase
MSTKYCLECGAPLPGILAGGLCSTCALRGALASGDDDTPTVPIEGVSEQGTFPAPLSCGQKFGDYELLEEIARGGMGVVYRARQLSLDRLVAVKTVLAGLSSAEYTKRFRTEASAAASLQHPHIVAIHEVGAWQGQQYLVMDYVEGQSLARLITRQPLTARRAAGYLKAIAEAVQYAHEHGILHRDLKPSNILIDATDQPRVTDFGLAKRFQEESQLTLSAQVLGSPSYMPPEQAEPKRGKVSRRSDIYGLGATLYHLLTGRAPFQGESPTEVLHQVLNADPVAPRQLNPSIPRDLETICLKCMEKEQARRYVTAQMVADELGRFLAGEPVLARSLGPVGKGWRWCRRKPVVAGLSAGLLVALVLGLAGVTWQWQRAERIAQKEARQRLRAEQNAYAADMHLAQQALDAGRLGQATDLLNRHRPRAEEPDLRGWEWRYLWRHCQSDALFTFCELPWAVSAVAVSPEGELLALADRSGSVTLWDIAARKQVATLPEAGQPKGPLAFSPHARLLASTGRDGVVKLWDARTLTEVAQLRHGGVLSSLAFSADGRRLATYTEGGRVSLWDVPTANLITNLPAPLGDDLAGRIVVSADGRLLAYGGYASNLRLVDTTTGEEKLNVAAHQDLGITALAISPDDSFLAVGTGYAHTTIGLWDVKTGSQVACLTNHTGWVWDLAFSPDGKTLASASADQTIRLWDVRLKQPAAVLRGCRSEVKRLAFLPDGNTLVSGAKDGSVCFWETHPRNREPDAVIRPATGDYSFRVEVNRRPAFSIDGKSLIALDQDGTVVQWDTTALQAVGRLRALGTNNSGLLFSPDGRLLVVGDGTGAIKVWDWVHQRLLTNWVAHQVAAIPRSFTPDGRLLVSNDLNWAVKLWKTGSWQEVAAWQARSNVRSAVLLPDGREMSIGYEDGTVIVNELLSGRETQIIKGHREGVSGLARTADGLLLATGGEDGLVRLLNPGTRKEIGVLRGSGTAVFGLGFSPDGQRLATCHGGPSDVVILWDVVTLRELITLSGLPKFHRLVIFSPDHNSLLAISINGDLNLWHAPSLAEIDAIEKGKAKEH